MKVCLQEIRKEVLCQGHLHSHCHSLSERAAGLLIWELSILTLDFYCQVMMVKLLVVCRKFRVPLVRITFSCSNHLT